MKTFSKAELELPNGLRRRLSAVFLSIIIGLSALNAFNVLWIGLYYRQLSTRLERQAKIQELISLVESEKNGIYNYSRNANPDYLQGLDISRNRIARILKSLQNGSEKRSLLWYRFGDVIRMRESYENIEQLLLKDVQRSLPSIYVRDRGDELVRLADYITGEVQQLASMSMDQLSDFYTSFSRRIVRVSSFSLGLLTLALILAIYNSRRFVLSVSRPIHLLALNLIQFGEGNLETRLGDINGQDEIAVLIQSFNQMADRIRSQIHDIRDKAELEQNLSEQKIARQEAERLLKEAELAHLHAQINPHFLFNTLNMLGSLSVLESAPKTGRIVSDLADLLRYSLRTGSGLVKLSAEISVIRSYMNIQKLRFGDKILFEETIDETVCDLMIPSMVLQPLAENAVKHGLEQIERSGRVSLSVVHKTDSIEISIEDNGVGISDKALSILNNPNIETESLGLRNVRRRLAIHFGNDVLEIRKANPAGTLCRIRIPA